MNMGQTMLLAGDIGGTKTDLAVYTAQGGPRVPRARVPIHVLVRRAALIGAAGYGLDLMFSENGGGHRGQRTHDTGQVSGDHGPR